MQNGRSSNLFRTCVYACIKFDDIVKTIGWVKEKSVLMIFDKCLKYKDRNDCQFLQKDKYCEKVGNVNEETIK